MRLDKRLCLSTTLDRDTAAAAIVQSRVTVAGVVVTEPRQQVHESQQVCLDGVAVVLRRARYFMLHKEAGSQCSNVDGVYPSVLNLLNDPRAFELHVAGRLDVDTTGLVLVTDDGRWTFNLTRPDKQCAKVYRVQLSRPLAADTASRFAAGLSLQGESQLTAPAQLQVLGSREALLTLTEGRFHQVKRMFAAVGNRVQQLHRQQIGDIVLDIKPGEWRPLTAAEIGNFAGDSDLDTQHAVATECCTPCVDGIRPQASTS
ncbi:16S rRNA pseudouridine516 synthase [Sinobacterium caligoides]|uniref:Pseudouridine synthase n=1 Tax=Sinobacterium caligoides TaxID=933926 RepID=A0A3N2DKN5_9GAMM|nr:pseudouridine synthase [Sinobacterium caligoides]ROS00360.1 16S rRNA pseudouridine516 synthase [Sinobacterium caligoides]